MLRSSMAWLLGLSMILSTSWVQAQGTGTGLISQVQAHRHGLHRRWLTQLDMNRTRDRLESIQLYLPPSPPPPPDAPADADPPPPEPTVIYTQTQQSVIQALDAETGRTLWINQVGGRNLPTLKPAINRMHVAVVNGSMLYLLRRDNGQLLSETELSIVPIASPSMSEDFVFVPGLSGKVHVMYVGISDDPVSSTWDYSAQGAATAAPLVTGDYVAWGTERGHIYVASNSRSQIDFRIEARDQVSTPLTYSAPYIYAASRDGNVYAIDERNGGRPWRYSLGEPLVEPPTVLNQRVYAISELGSLHCVTSQVGALKWTTSGIGQFVAATDSRLYVTDRKMQRLLALGKTSGARQDSMVVPKLELYVTNNINDRIYTATQDGLVQCLHEVGQSQPRFHHLVKPEEPAPPMEPAADAAPADGNDAPADNAF